ncbi:hypothetical protein [Shewanella nanhaiensis]|uniref:Uncharacterized protein n=1 Tax=Shewanella nanhaiensis TaxID=2864872 RepID=A0ABS7DZG4_9GAMM|nr:hypothetical protein [Shewanella nanhaiensis]MBW8182801.1 hypothetical protein [Shewanella nanhaiensis]
MIKSVYGYPKTEFSTTWLKLLEAVFGEADLMLLLTIVHSSFSHSLSSNTTYSL